MIIPPELGKPLTITLHLYGEWVPEYEATHPKSTEIYYVTDTSAKMWERIAALFADLAAEEAELARAKEGNTE